MSETITGSETIPHSEETISRRRFYQPTNVIEYVQEIEVMPVVRRYRSFSYPNKTMLVLPHNFYSLLAQHDRINETYQKLKSLKKSGVIDDKTMIEVMKQKVFLEDNIDQVLGHGRYVVVSGEQFFFGDTLDEAIKNAKEVIGNRPYHSETIDFIDYPTPFS